jgi:ABC-type phosphate/phosphonate transport system permease subunit
MLDGAQPARAQTLAYAAKAVLDVARAVHTWYFGLVLVGIVGLGPTAGILAIALHSMGTYGKLFAESIETLDMAAVDAVRATGAVIRAGLLPAPSGRRCCRSSSAATCTCGSSTSATRPCWA